MPRTLDPPDTAPHLPPTRSFAVPPSGCDVEPHGDAVVVTERRPAQLASRRTNLLNRLCDPSDVFSW